MSSDLASQKAGLGLIQRQLAYVTKYVPHYKGMAGKISLDSFPLLKKSDIQSDYASFVSDQPDPIIRNSVLRDLGRKQDVYEGVSEHGVLINETSGTSGVPLRCARSVEDRLALGVGIWRQRRRIDPAITPPGLYRFNHPGTDRRRYHPGLLTLENLQALYADVARTRARWIHAAPSRLQKHLEVFRGAGWSPTLPDLHFLECTSEFVDRELAESFRKAFGAQVVNQYGMMETWTIALGCQHGVHHVNENNVHVEILDANDRPAVLRRPGPIVVTSIQQRLMPFIRYITNDYAMWVDPPCDCRLGGRTFVLLNGRESELICGDDKIVFGNKIFAKALRHAHRTLSLEDLRHLRVHQTEADLFVLRTNPIRDGDGLCNLVRTVVSDWLGRPIRVLQLDLTEAEIQKDSQGKPWLFRRMME
jgi:phenylacetate-CoA ligase